MVAVDASVVLTRNNPNGNQNYVDAQQEAIQALMLSPSRVKSMRKSFIHRLNFSPFVSRKNSSKMIRTFHC